MKIENILNETIQGDKEVDFYTPVKIDYPENDEKEKELFYYRLLNPKSSFVEVSISSTTKKIVSITVVSINDITEADNTILEKVSFLGKTGNPEIDMSLFKNEHIVTDNISFNVIRHEKKIYILCDIEDIERKLTMDNLDILVDNNNNIVGYILGGFTEVEWEEINESIDSSIGVAKEYQS